ncbi:tRNA pseudouridine(55) synthase TruB [Mycoplasmopsis gallinarum]|uniref:tRNA pseudouridine(55) synthase TruB n=1 Tax=Mycoplasmopsis gallinarum TaxID=29557 RepID=UPI00048445E6|nr:tRNA pseudouridine(55) synthase TruB [Mycoplasmopsis gallinarum]
MFYLINKTKNISSFKAIRDFANKLNIKKIGHSGTLDPMATGLLLVATDEDTKLISYLKNKQKTYLATIQFGAQTDTYDAEGKIIKISNEKVREEQIEKIISWFYDQKLQKPPIYSAKKINGQKGYELARKNQTVELKEQEIKVSEVKINEFDFAKQELKVELEVSNGTYIRSLANDLGLYLNTFAYLSGLERTKISTLDKKLLNESEFVKIDVEPLLSLPILKLDFKIIQRLKKGLSHTFINNNFSDSKYFLVDEINPKEILGIVNLTSKELKAEKLFGNKLQKY